MNEELFQRGQTMTNEEIYALLTEEQKTALQAIAAELVEKIAESIKVLTPIMCEIGKRIKRLSERCLNFATAFIPTTRP